MYAWLYIFLAAFGSLGTSVGAWGGWLAGALAIVTVTPPSHHLSSELFCLWLLALCLPVIHHLCDPHSFTPPFFFFLNYLFSCLLSNMKVEVIPGQLTSRSLSHSLLKSFLRPRSSVPLLRVVLAHRWRLSYNYIFLISVIPRSAPGLFRSQPGLCLFPKCWNPESLFIFPFGNREVPNWLEEKICPRFLSPAVPHLLMYVLSRW